MAHSSGYTYTVSPCRRHQLLMGDHHQTECTIVCCHCAHLHVSCPPHGAAAPPVTAAAAAAAANNLPPAPALQQSLPAWEYWWWPPSDTALAGRAHATAPLLLVWPCGICLSTKEEVCSHVKCQWKEEEEEEGLQPLLPLAAAADATSRCPWPWCIPPAWHRAAVRWSAAGSLRSMSMLSCAPVLPTKCAQC